MASLIYNSAVDDMARGAIDFDTDTFKAMLVTSTLATGPAAAYLAPGSDLTITWSMVVSEHSITSTGAALTTSWSVSAEQLPTLRQAPASQPPAA